MARSTLVSLLQSWARDIEREQRSERGESFDPGRRAVIGGGLALSGMSAVPRWAFAGAGKPRIAVVGAGLAGLTAAYRLKQAGFDPTLYEGNTRLGGRCYTVRDTFKQGQLAEHGGEFIDTDHTEIRSLAKELGLHLDDVLAAQPAGTTEKYRFNNLAYNLAAATKDFQALYPIVQKQNDSLGDTIDYTQSNNMAKFYDAMTLRDWIKTYVSGGLQSKLGQLLDNAFSEENAADTSQQSALNIIYTIAEDAKNNFNLYYTGSDQRFHVRGGNDQITTLLGVRLGNAVQTGARLAAIARRSDGRITLTLQREASFRDEIYDRVILALPFAVMRAAVDYSHAGFRDLKRRAIQTLGMGASVKTQVQVERRLWNELGCDGEIRLRSDIFQTSWDVTRAQPGKIGIFNFWSGGSQAVHDGTLNDASLVEACFSDAQPILPGLGKLWNGIASVDVWKKNIWSLGSYSYYPPNYQTTIYGIEKEPEGNCFFAGEHTWSEAGYLNAGVASGDRAAKQVMRSLTS